MDGMQCAQTLKITGLHYGSSLDIDIRLEIIKLIFSLSQSTTVHVKDLASGAEGLIPFVKAILKGF
jgi:hypothetical protein